MSVHFPSEEEEVAELVDGAVRARPARSLRLASHSVEV